MLQMFKRRRLKLYKGKPNYASKSVNNNKSKEGTGDFEYKFKNRRLVNKLKIDESFQKGGNTNLNILDFNNQRKPKTVRSYGFTNKEQGNYIIGSSLNFPGNVSLNNFNVIPTQSNPYFKGISETSLRIPFEGLDLGIGVNYNIGNRQLKPRFNIGFKQRFAKGGINTTGYTPGTDTYNNDYNIIPSSNITMKKTPFPILGIDDLGNKQLMQPGNEYQFPGNRVLEIPIKENNMYNRYQRGGQSYFDMVKTQAKRLKNRNVKRNPQMQFSTAKTLGILPTQIQSIEKDKRVKATQAHYIQELLKNNGYNVGKIDGIIGPKTKAAIRQYQKDRGLKVDGIVGKNTLAALTSNKKSYRKSHNTLLPKNTKYSTEGLKKIYKLQGKPTFDVNFDGIHDPLNQGVVVDKRTGRQLNIKNGKIVGKYDVLTGAAVNSNNHPSKKAIEDMTFADKSTPTGYYNLEIPGEGIIDSEMKSYNGNIRRVTPTSYEGFPQTTNAEQMAYHQTYDPVNRLPLYGTKKPWASYGCINGRCGDVEETNRLFPNKTNMRVIDSRNPNDAAYFNQYQYQQGGKHPFITGLNIKKIYNFPINPRRKAPAPNSAKYASLGVVSPTDSANYENGWDMWSNHWNPNAVHRISDDAYFTLASKRDAQLQLAREKAYKETGNWLSPKYDAPFKLHSVKKQEGGSIGLRKNPGPVNLDRTPINIQSPAYPHTGLNNEYVATEDYIYADDNNDEELLYKSPNYDAPVRRSTYNDESIKQRNNILANKALDEGRQYQAMAEHKGHRGIRGGLRRLFTPKREKQYFETATEGMRKAVDNYKKYKFGSFQQGGENNNNNQMEQILQQVAQMLQQGAQPEEVLAQLVEMGMSEQEAAQMIQMVMQQMQGGQGQPMMQSGGQMSNMDFLNSIMQYQQGGNYLPEYQEAGYYEGDDYITDYFYNDDFSQDAFDGLASEDDRNLKIKRNPDGSIRKVKMRGRKLKFDNDGNVRKSKINSNRYNPIGYSYDYIPDSEYYLEEDRSEIETMKKEMDKTVYAPDPEPVAKPVTNWDDRSFKEAFKHYRKELGDGQVFEWRGKKYTTKLAGSKTKRKYTSKKKSTVSRTKTSSGKTAPKKKIVKKTKEEIDRLKRKERRLTAITGGPLGYYQTYKNNKAVIQSIPSVIGGVINKIGRWVDGY